MNIDPGSVAAIVVPSITALVWLLRLEGRVNTNEKSAADAVKKLSDDIIYVRSRIDAALGERGRRG